MERRSSGTAIIDSTYKPFDRESFEELFGSLYDSDFKPYSEFDIHGKRTDAGDALLLHRLGAKSRVLRDYPLLGDILTEAFESGDTGKLSEAAELTQLAVLESLQGRENQPPINTIFSHVCLARNISDMAIEANSEKPDLGAVNYIAHQVALIIAQSIPDDMVEGYRATAQYLMQRVKQVVASSDYNFIRAKISVLDSMLFSRDITQRYAETIPHVGPDEIVDPAEVNRDSAEIADLFGEIRAARHYDPKLAYKRHRLGGSLIFGSTNYDIDSTEPGFFVHPLVYNLPTVARVIHSTSKSPNSLKPDVVRQRGVMSHDYTYLKPAAIIHIGANGELYADAFGAISIRDIFVRQGKYREYRKLQAEILAAYFDMTQPAEIILGLQKEHPGSFDFDGEGNNGEPMDVIGTLVVPRIRYVHENRLDVGSEDDSVYPDKQDTGSKKRRHHPVVMHRRKLPEGWHPSPEAIQLATDANYDLEPGWTIVKSHDRGSRELGEVAGHRLLHSDN